MAGLITERIAHGTVLNSLHRWSDHNPRTHHKPQPLYSRGTGFQAVQSEKRTSSSRSGAHPSIHHGQPGWQVVRSWPRNIHYLGPIENHRHPGKEQ